MSMRLHAGSTCCGAAGSAGHASGRTSVLRQRGSDGGCLWVCEELAPVDGQRVRQQSGASERPCSLNTLAACRPTATYTASASHQQVQCSKYQCSWHQRLSRRPNPAPNSAPCRSTHGWFAKATTCCSSSDSSLLSQ